MLVVLITGCNRGIGLELCHQYLLRGDFVIATCRQTTAELQALQGPNLQIIPNFDVSDYDTIIAASELLRERSIDIVINNAGVITREGIDNLDFRALTTVLDVNSLGPLRVVKAFMPRLAPGARLAFVSSVMGSSTTNVSGGRYAYRMSKAALNIACVSLARDLHPRGVSVAILHPGFVRTDMSQGRGELEPAVSAVGMMRVIDNLTLATSGTFWQYDGAVLPW